MAFVARYRTVCNECGNDIEPGQLASFSYSEYKHAVCPEERAPGPVCPDCYTELPVSGICGVCE